MAEEKQEQKIEKQEQKGDQGKDKKSNPRRKKAVKPQQKDFKPSKKLLLIEELNEKLLLLDEKELKQVSFFTDKMKTDKYNTFIYIADGMMGKIMYYKTTAFNSIQSSAKNALGVKLDSKQFTNIWDKMDKVVKSMDEVIDEAYELNIGNRWDIDKHNKEKEKALRAVEEEK